MMKNLLYSISFLITLMGCNILFEEQKEQARNFQAEIAQLEVERATLQNQALQQAKDSLEALLLNKPPLVHLVLLTLKSTADIEQVRAELNRLRSIEEIADFELGNFEDLKDKRALSSYQIIMHTAFHNEEDYRVYSEHPTHLDVKAKLKKLLAGPPAVYDYKR